MKLQEWLEKTPGALVNPQQGLAVVIHDMRSIAEIRAELFHLEDYRVMTVAAGVIRLWPNHVAAC